MGLQRSDRYMLQRATKRSFVVWLWTTAMFQTLHNALKWESIYTLGFDAAKITNYIKKHFK